MKILQVEYMKDYASLPSHRDTVLLKYLLRKSIMNDYLLENTWFSVALKPDSVMDFMYRRLWETVYLRTKRQSSYDTNTGVMTLWVSLADIIQYIRSATPPRLSSSIEDSIKDIDNIVEILKQFLMGDNGGHTQFYISLFKQLTRMEPFETFWDSKMFENSLTSLHLLRNTYEEYFQGTSNLVSKSYNVVGCFIGMTETLDDVSNEELQDDLVMSIQMLFHCKKPIEAISIIELLGNFNVLNINTDNTGTYIMIYKSNHTITPRFNQYLIGMNEVIKQAMS